MHKFLVHINLTGISSGKLTVIEQYRSMRLRQLVSHPLNKFFLKKILHTLKSFNVLLFMLTRKCTVPPYCCATYNCILLRYL